MDFGILYFNELLHLNVTDNIENIRAYCDSKFVVNSLEDQAQAETLPIRLTTLEAFVPKTDLAFPALWMSLKFAKAGLKFTYISRVASTGIRINFLK